MRLPLRPSVALLAAALLTLAGCGDQSSAGTAAPSGSEVAASESAGSPSGTGKVADYDFAATTLDGEPFSGTTLADKPAVLWFWAPWCPTCRAQIPALTQLAEEYAGEVSVVGVGGLDEEPAIEELAEEIPHVTHLVDADGEVWKHFGVTAQSTYTVIAADGEIMSEGYLDDGELADLVAQLAG